MNDQPKEQDTTSTGESSSKTGRQPASRGLSVKHKTLLSGVLASMFSLLVASVCYYVFTSYQLRQDLLNDLRITAELASGIAAPSLTFDDAAAVQEGLAPLQADQSISKVCVYDTSLVGEVGLLAGYVRDGVTAACPESPGPVGSLFTDYSVILVDVIRLFGEDLGTLYIVKDNDGINKNLDRHKAVALLIFVIGGLVALLVVSLLQHWAIGPVLNLAGAVSRADISDHSLRVDTNSSDEAGLLAARVNQLLEDAQQTRAELKQKHDELQQFVSERQSAGSDAEAVRLKIERVESQLIQGKRALLFGNVATGFAAGVESPVGVGVMAVSTLHDKAQEILAEFEGGKLKKSSLEKFIHQSVQSSDIVKGSLSQVSDLVFGFKQVSEDQTANPKRDINVREYFSAVIENLMPKIQQARHQFELVCEPTIRVSTLPGAWATIITNLVMNSLLHGYEEGESGEMQLTVTATSDGLEVNYLDDGRGMAKQTIDQLFDPNADEGTASSKSGLGMYLLHHLVKDALNGRVSVQSDVGQGVHFRIQVPITAPK